MDSFDPFRVTDALAEPLLSAMSTRLEARGRHPRFAAMLEEYLAAMELDAAQVVLDLGCGTGVAARAIARRRPFSGQVVGVDRSPYLVATATQLATSEGLSERVTFHVGDTSQLQYADASVDAIVAHTLLSHVDDPSAVLQEAARVLRPGGRLGIFDGDYASLSFGQADAARAKADDEALIGGLVTNPYVMRQLPRLLQAVGLEVVETFAYVLAEIGRAEFWGSAIEVYRRLLPQSRAMTEMAADAWAERLMTAHAEGVFFGTSNYYSYLARRP